MDFLTYCQLIHEPSTSHREGVQLPKIPVDLLKEIFDEGQEKSVAPRLTLTSSPEGLIYYNYSLYEDSSLKVSAKVTRLPQSGTHSQDSECKVDIEMILQNIGDEVMNDFQLRMAVPKVR